MPNLFKQPPRLPLIAPSILSADFARMEAECRSVLEPESGDRADLLHLDVMDGHFVPNLTMGPDLCRALRRAFPEVMLDVHLMVTNPTQYIAPFRDAGADHLTIHIEPSAPNWESASGGGGGPRGEGYAAHEVASHIRAAGMTAGIALNPPTNPAWALEVVDFFDLVLVMSVNPGYSGQSFIEASLETTRRVREQLRRDQRLQMDGGVSTANAGAVREAGCDVLVAASAIFGRPAKERGGVITRLRGGS